jgi:hypothetical protein
MRVLGSLIVLVAMMGVRFAQTTTKPDLSGVWTLDGSRSKVDPRLAEKVEGYVLTIVHKEPEIRITRRYQKDGRNVTDESVYYTNGKAEINSRTGRKDYEPKTRWRGNKLVRRTVWRAPGSIPETFPPLEVTTTEEWELSSDGKTLTRTVTLSGTLTGKFRYVFNRTS